MIFINLPITDLQKSIAFYTALGWKNDPAFTNDQSAMMKLSANISVMLHIPSRYTEFVPKGRGIANAKTHTEVLNALSCQSREEVDEWVRKAGEAGGTVDVGFHAEMKGEDGTVWMYGRSFDDLDGHVWEVVWMHEQAAENPEVLAEAKEEKVGEGK
jgi:predicted lactoylglutathione lyase